MSSCDHCQSDLPGEARYCPGCGEPTHGDTAMPTWTRPLDPLLSPLPDDGRFLPGQILGRRYRISGLLGRGGMGEVYRADDLKLGQTLALKLLPEDFERQPERLALLQHEVRLALRVTHPNVCRVYDLGEADGHHFLSMEFLDGEDLASLLRRVGRLPRDRALRVARQLCAGLAAIHEQNIVHRDLKPANILIDGHGSARITDFGLAGIAAGPGIRSGLAGTPAYMAPEQLSGGEATVHSDIYGLGLVLYELFTGRAVFTNQSITGLRRLHETTHPPSPSSLVEGLDPVVERVIMRCLEEEPGQRPASALLVAAALPGGDPLAAALAAGEVPSPALVAEAGQHAGLPPGGAVGLGILVAAGLVACALLAGQSQVTRVVPLPHPPAVLENEARILLSRSGVNLPSGDAAGGFEIDLEALRRWSDPESRQETGRAPVSPPAAVPIRYWYRVSPHPLVPIREQRNGAVPDDPPGDRPGMALVRLDPEGRLLSLLRVPETTGQWPEQQGPPDWAPLIRAAGFDPASLSAVSPRHPPGVAADSLAAWEPATGNPAGPVILEAAALGSQPVAFRVSVPSDDEARTDPEGVLAWASAGVETIWYLAALFLGAVLARRHLRRGHGDRQGALRVALAVLVARLLSWLLSAHHVEDPRELDLFIGATAWAVYSAVLLWVLYVAIEPLFRAYWPRQMTSWARLLQGRLRDPLVGRDALVGLAFGVVLALNTDLYHALPRWLGLPVPALNGLTQLDGEMRALSGGLHLLSLLLDKLVLALRNGFIGVTLLVLLRMATGRDAAAIGAWLAMGMVLFNPMAGSVWWDLAIALLQVGLFTLALLRFGFLTATVAVSVLYLLLSFPLTTALSAWYADGTLLVMGLLLAATAGSVAAAAGFHPRHGAVRAARARA